jgi:uncharacterized protein YndB with AHSA1/START domain
MSASATIPPIELVLETTAAPADAWLAITDPARIVLWLTEATPLGPVGSAYRLDFGDGTVVGEVLELEPGRRFSHAWRWEGRDPADVTTVTWSVEPRAGGGSRVRLVHAGWGEAAGMLARDDHEAYWAGYLDDLRDVLEPA